MSVIHRATGLLIIFLHMPVCAQVIIRLPFPEIREINIMQRQQEADTALYLIRAADNGNIDSVRMLIEKGYDVNETTGDGVTALMYAASRGFTDIVRLLVKNEAAIDAIPYNRLTALTSAVINNHYDVVLFLLQQGADTEIADEKKVTPLLYAVANDYFEITELLLMFGANPHHTDREGATALHAAAIYAQPDIAWLLLDYGADIDKRDDFGFTPLMMAVQLGRSDMAEYLLSANAGIHLKTVDGLSALALAIANNQPELARKLIELGADPGARISGTENLMNLARWQGNKELVTLLREHGVRRNIIPDFGTLRISGNILMSRGDFFNGPDISMEDNKYNLHLSAGWYTRPVRRAVLLEFDEYWHDQLWEQRHLFYGGLSVKFPVMNYFRINERGFFAGVKVMYSKGRYWGTYRYPEPDWHVVPSAGYYNEGNRWFYKIGYEYLQLDILDKPAHRITVGAGIRFPVKKDPLIYRTIYW
ncbi:MAG: ankyrin repeat domain-containing protein [Bacteroidales bacterium]